MVQTQSEALWRGAFRASWPVSVCHFVAYSLSLVTVAQLHQYGQRWPLWSPLCVSSLEYVGRLQKAVRASAWLRGKKHTGGSWPVVAAFLASCAVAPICAAHGRVKPPCVSLDMCSAFPSCVLASAPINKHSFRASCVKW